MLLATSLFLLRCMTLRRCWSNAYTDLYDRRPFPKVIRSRRDTSPSHLPPSLLLFLQDHLTEDEIPPRLPVSCVDLLQEAKSELLAVADQVASAPRAKLHCLYK
jgi:hypothetical protein